MKLAYVHFFIGIRNLKVGPWLFDGYWGLCGIPQPDTTKNWKKVTCPGCLSRKSEAKYHFNI